MNKFEVKQQLLQLESRDVVQKWFEKIHNSKINALRTKEINFAAKLASEYLRNAEYANFTVRPLLTYYGINLLSKALVLLLKERGGENSLKPGHGLETRQWSNILFGSNISDSLNKLGLLEVETSHGILSELMSITNNCNPVHINSTSIDWSIDYNIPNIGYRLTLNDILSRIPDLNTNLINIEIEQKYSHVLGHINYNNDTGFKCEVYSTFKLIKDFYFEFGYEIEEKSNSYQLYCKNDLFVNNLPVFYHKHLDSPFGIPQLYIVQPFNHNVYYSEIAVTFMLSYYLGMLVRYFPTHWTSLVQGENGDMYWPILNRAQNYVESVFPKLVLELINDKLSRNK